MISSFSFAAENRSDFPGASLHFATLLSAMGFLPWSCGVLQEGLRGRRGRLHFELKGQPAIDGTELEGYQAGDGGEDSPLRLKEIVRNMFLGGISPF